jgi:RNA polymerase sigma factor (sigma-70 family)
MQSDDELERLVTRYASLIDAAIRRVCARHYNYVVPDVRQEVHLAIWRQLEAGNKPVREASYIYKVALTTALREVRRIQRERDTAAAKGLVDEQMHVAIDPDGDLERAEQLDFALGALEGRQRQAVKAYLAGFNHGEIADLLGISPAQARHAVYRGIERIHRALAAQEQAAND